MDRLPVYVVNLKRKPELKKGFAEKNLWLKNIIFTEAFDAHKETLPPHKQKTPGALGCFISHYNIWKRIAEGNDDWALVAEDDHAISPNLKNDLEQVIQSMQGAGVNVGILDWRVPTYGDTQTPPPAGKGAHGVSLVPVDSVFWGTHLYLINKEGARRSLQAHDPTGSTPVDVAMADRSKDGSVPAVLVMLPYDGAKQWSRHESTTGVVSYTEGDTTGRRRAILPLLLLLIVVIVLVRSILK